MIAFEEAVRRMMEAHPEAGPAELARLLAEPAQAAAPPPQPNDFEAQTPETSSGGVAEMVGRNLGAQALAIARSALAIGWSALAAGPAGKPGDALDALLDRAAVLGAFSLDALVPREVPDAARLRSALLRRSLPELGAPDRCLLAPAARRERLDALRRAGRLAEVVEANPAEPDDPLGQQLQATLLGSGSLDEALAALDGPEPMKEAALRQTLRVASWIEPVDSPSAAQGALRTALTAAGEARRLEEEIAGFVGREPLLDWIEATLFPGAEPGGGDFPPTVALYGIGGIGKSAILAKLQVRLAQRRHLLFVSIDFDRPGLDTADPTFLTREMLVQLRRQVPVLLGSPVDEPVSPPRSQGIANQAEEFESATTEYDLALEALRRSARATLASERPVLLLLDTFEERQRGGSASVDEITEWLRDLVAPYGGGLQRLVVLMAGRAEPTANGYPFPPHDARRVDHLGRSEAVALLEALGHPPDEARELARVDGNPLLLKLVSHLVRRGGQDPRALTAGLEAEGDDPALLQGIVYERILLHVRDPDARRLAYPGLVVREVTPVIIAEVMAPACLGRSIGMAEAERLFAALASEVWLVERVAPDRVRHRADIRRAMMHRLLRDGASRETAAELHRRAAAFFGPDAPEAAYHRTMLARPESLAHLDAAEARRLIEQVGFDEEFLPRDVRATLRALAGDPLSDAEVGLLPATIWQRTLDALGPGIVARGHFDRALALWEARPSGAATVPPIWHRRAEDASVRWDTEEAERFVRAVPPPEADLLDWIDAAVLAELRRNHPTRALAVALGLTSALGIGGETPPDFFDATALGLYRHWRGLDAGPGLQGIDLGRVASPTRGAAKAERARIARVVNYAAIACHMIPETGGRCLSGPAPAWGDAERLHNARSIAVDAGLWLELRRAQRLGVTEPDPRLPVTGSVFVPSPAWLQAVIESLPDAPASVRFGLDGLLRRVEAAGTEARASMLTGTEADLCAGALNTAMLAGAPLAGPLYDSVGFPEHRIPLRQALEAAVLASGRPIASAMVDLLEQLRALAGFAGVVVPRDLAPLEGRRVTRSRLDRVLIRFVAYADQAGILPELAREAAALFGTSEALVRVRDDLDRWARVLPAPAWRQSGFRPNRSTPFRT